MEILLKADSNKHKQRYDHYFFLAMAIILLVTFFIGFAPSYYLAGMTNAPLPDKTIHIHAIVFTIWILLYITQVSLVFINKVNLHRQLGMISFVFTFVMVTTGLMASVDALKRTIAPGVDELLFIINITMTLGFASFVAAAYKMRSTPASHKRFMLMANIALVFAGLIRWPVDLLYHNIPLAARASYLFLLPIVLYDLWSIRKIHRVTLWSGILMIVIFELRFIIAETAVWLEFVERIKLHS
jgi:uncharacterized membrane protein